MRRPLFATLFTFASLQAQAACTNPVADMASVFYNTTVNTVQFCDGTDWVNTAIKSPSATGTACTTPTGPEGSMYYNTSQNTVQFCNGDSWVNMGTMRFPSATGTQCTTPTGPEGSMFFNTTVNRMQFCNGDDWVNATYFTVAQQAIQGIQTHKLIASDAGSSDAFGYSVSISDGKIAVGAHFEDSGATDGGSVYIFDATTGAQLRKVVSTDIQGNDFFGQSVAISSGNLVVGAPNEDAAGSNAGAVYIFDASTGTQLRKITADDAQAGETFGHSVAASGNKAIVGSRYKTTTQSNTGAAYIFDITDGSQLHRLVALDAEDSDNFGYSVAIDADVAVVGAHMEDSGGSNLGAAYVFDLDTGAQRHKLAPIDGQSTDYFGYSISVSNGKVVVGAKNEDEGGADAGAAYIFDTSTGAQLHKLMADDALANDNFGESVAISGNTVVIGARGSDTGGNNAGVIYVFDASTGAQLHKIVASDAQSNDNFGQSVAIDANAIAVGAHLEDEGASDAGAAYIFK
jgi:hypothetical protein